MIRCTFCDYKNPPGATRCTSCGAELPGSLNAGDESLADTLLDLLRTGQKTQAVALYRERTRSGLKEANDAVEALGRGDPLPSPKSILTTVDQDVVSLVREGKTIDAIKLYRSKTGVGLAEARQAVEQLARDHGIQSRGSGCSGAVLALIVIASLLVDFFW